MKPMRQVKAMLCVAFLLFGTLNEFLHHHHEIGESDSDCVACQFHHAALGAPGAVSEPRAPAPQTGSSPEPMLAAVWVTHPLIVAPKTSPPLSRLH